jgi:peptidoglycan/LPS O-acetylase OafA/YrhL
VPSGATEARPRDHELDGLRGIAVGLVLACHVAIQLGYSWAPPLGALGVQLFFALSGFLITRLLVRELDASGAIDLKRFYLRRALRIFPAFYVFLAVVGLLILGGLVTDTNWKSFTAAAVYISNIRGSSVTLGHTWSLALEEQFYALWPLSLTLIPTSRRRQITLGIILVFFAWRAVAIGLDLWPYGSSVFYERTDFRLDSLLLGGLLAMRPPGIRNQRPAVRVAGLGLSIIGFALSPALSHVHFLRPLALTATAIFAAGVVRGVLDCAGAVGTAWLRGSTLRGLGRISYSVYLWQQPVLLAPLISSRIPGGAVGGLAVCLGLGTASYLLVERPMLRLRQSYSTWSPALAGKPAA